MRRFIAYLLACITIFLGIGISFKPVATNIKGDLAYRNGQEMSFRIYNHNDESTPIEEEHIVKDYANTMESRLKAFGTTDYKITTHGLDTITVTLTGRNKEEYDRISTLLSTNPIIELATTAEEGDNKYVIKDEKKAWHSTTAYLEYSGNTTIVVKPIPAAYKSEISELKAKAEKIEKKEEPKSNDEPKEPTKSIVLWMNRKEGELYTNKDKDTNVKSKIIQDFSIETFFYNKDESLMQMSFAPASTKGADIRAAYDKAVYYMNLLNIKETDYDCRTIYSKEIPATVENLLVFGDRVSVAMSWTLISLLLGFAIIAGFLIFFYKLPTLAIMTTASLTSFLTLFIFTLFNPLFNISAVVGLIGVFLASIATGVAHNNFLHEEVYKGRSLKKANYEASKKTTLLTVDISAIFLLFGVLIYFIGGNTVSSLGVMFIIGALLNLFINTFLFKGLMWLLTNNTNFQKKYKVFAINPKQVPDLAKEEKITYEPPFAKNNLNKRVKPAGIIFGVLTFASAIGMILFGSLNKTMFNSSKYYKNSNEIYINMESNVDPCTSDDIINNVLKNIKNNDKALNYNSDILSYNYEVHSTDASQIAVTKKFYEFVITINDNDLEKETFSYKDNDKTYLSNAIRTGISETIYHGESLKVDYKLSTPVTIASNSGLIIAGTLTSVAIAVIYLWIRRYKASRITSIFIVSAASTTISLGVLALCRIPATPVMAIGGAITAIASILLGMFIILKDKDLYRDERIKSVESRKSTLNKAMIFALSPVFIFGLLAIFASIGYYGITAKFYSAVFLIPSIGITIALLMYMILFAPIANFLDDKFSRVKIPEIKIRKKKKINKKSNEPEEAIFIGIND